MREESMNDKEYALIVAGGKGLRMGSSIPKQYIEIGGLPIIFHTIQAFIKYNPNIICILVIPRKDFGYFENIKAKYGFQVDIKMVEGGQTRFQSVRNGLDTIPNQGIVAIHDGVRPFLKPQIIKDSFEKAEKYGAAIATMPLKESLRILETSGDSHSKAVDRTLFRSVQTPQTFQNQLIKEAYKQEEQEIFTDEASVIENIGGKVEIFNGSYENIKITTPEDLLLAEILIKKYN